MNELIAALLGLWKCWPQRLPLTMHSSPIPIQQDLEALGVLGVLDPKHGYLDTMLAGYVALELHMLGNFIKTTVLRSWTQARVLKLLHRWLGANPLTHLNAKTPSIYLRKLVTGSHLHSLNTGVNIWWSNFRFPVMILPAKFWTFCSFEIVFFEVLDHTGEHQ